MGEKSERRKARERKGEEGRERERKRDRGGEVGKGGREGTWVKQWPCPSHQMVVLSTTQGVYCML